MCTVYLRTPTRVPPSESWRGDLYCCAAPTKAQLGPSKKKTQTGGVTDGSFKTKTRTRTLRTKSRDNKEGSRPSVVKSFCRVQYKCNGLTISRHDRNYAGHGTDRRKHHRSPSINLPFVATRYSPPVCWPRLMATTPSPAFGASRFASLPRHICFQTLWRGRSRGSCIHGYEAVGSGGDGSGLLLLLLLGCSFGSKRCESRECQGVCQDQNVGGSRILSASKLT